MKQKKSLFPPPLPVVRKVISRSLHREEETVSLRKLKRSKKKGNGKLSGGNAAEFFAMADEHKNHGRPTQAVSCYRQGLRLDPRRADAVNSLGNTLHLLERTAEAIACYRSACELLPDSPQVHYNLGTALYQAGQMNEAMEQLNQTIALDPRYAEAYAGLGVALQATGDLEGAQAALYRAIDLKPAYPEAQRFLGLVMKDLGDIAGAVEKFTAILRENPNDAFTRYLLSRYKRYTAADEGEISSILSQLSDPTLTPDNAVFLHFALGKIFDDCKKHDKAFHHYQLANRLKRSTFETGKISTGIELGRIRRAFTPQLFSRLRAAGNPSRIPVFIVGMPRSGTTLVEQICASHSGVHGAGELKLIRFLKEKLPSLGSGKTPYPECLAMADTQAMQCLGEEYLAGLPGNLPKNISRITDKMPTNFIDLGLIHILFPGARIIHCRRDPRDTCLSNYFQYFEEGNECSYDLEDLALYYRKYRELMAFWRVILPAGSILEMDYEELVGNFAAQSRKLIDFLGLNWEESCLDFFKTKRMVHTASDWQVRQPIYTKSLHRWQNYEPYLQPLLQGLASTSRLT